MVYLAKSLNDLAKRGEAIISAISSAIPAHLLRGMVNAKVTEGWLNAIFYLNFISGNNNLKIMEDFSSILNHLAPHITFNEEEKELFISVLRMKKVKRKQLLEQPGYVSKYRMYVTAGAVRGFFIGIDGQEHTISLAVDGGFIGDSGSFLFQEPATLFIEAIEDSSIIQWSYESEQLLLKRIPQYSMVMMQRAQQIAVMIQRRVISHLSLSAEERYEEFAKSYPTFVHRIPLYIIASYLGMTREFLSKIRNQKKISKR